ncbi:GNAT family N-acetyltransferase [Demequina activiva]|uniref:N-acetyltransferase domain-containing protein n=1 Tax=Demequina activiva TaxID=1582364 RepID=A0A919Q2X9_9MICO|nr:GNAT family N-acetyltransferase [Demequina activiva]GIG54871.1 hypothetical protein Dac01nite_16230 [Demequina activiva]
MSEHGAGAGSDPAPALVRLAVLSDDHDAAAVSRMLAAYLLETEREKGASVAGASALPERYRHEVEQPARAFAAAEVWIAQADGAIAGMAVLTAPEQGRCEIKRLWTEPWARGTGVGRRLVEHCVDRARGRRDTAVELTVWRWREGAIRLYERAGFAAVESWDDRAGLVCLRHVLRDR